MRRLPLLLMVGLAVPAGAVAQSWSAPERELLGQLEACWQAADESHENWVRVCNPTSDMVFWWTEDPAPMTSVEWWEATSAGWHERYERIAWDVRPMNIRFYDEIGIIYYYWTQQLRKTADGEIVTEQGGFVEMYRRVGGSWEYLGGMGFPVAGS